MTSREQFDEWLNDGVYAEIEHHYKDHHKNFGLMAWQARGELDAKRIAELEAVIVMQRETIQTLNSCIGGEGSLTTDNLVTIGRLEARNKELEALAEQLTQEPVKTKPYGYVWFDMNMEKRFTNIYPPITGEKALGEATPLYTHPKQWQSLSDDEVHNIWFALEHEVETYISYGAKLARAIEAKLREKNT